MNNQEKAERYVEIILEIKKLEEEQKNLDKELLPLSESFQVIDLGKTLEYNEATIVREVDNEKLYDYLIEHNESNLIKENFGITIASLTKLKESSKDYLQNLVDSFATKTKPKKAFFKVVDLKK